MKWGLVIANPAERALREVEAADLDRIDAVFEEMCVDPYHGDVKFCAALGARCVVGSASSASSSN